MRFLLFIAMVVVAAIPAQSRANDSGGLDYSALSYRDISQLAWKYNLHDYNNDDAIDTYASIANCDLFRKYSGDDFGWQMVREGLRRNIRYYADGYNDRFEIRAVVPIDRYDFSKLAIMIAPDFALSNAGAIQLPINTEGLICDLGMGKEIQSFFPFNIKFATDDNFSLSEIPLSPDNARNVLKNISLYKYEEIGGRRAVTLRFRVKISGIKSYDPNAQKPEIIYKGQLDEIAFFEDPKMTKPIWIKTLKVLD
jgi:hypothetical protein